MGSTSRRKSTPLIQSLYERPGEFDFFQAVRLLERAARSRRGSSGAAAPAAPAGAHIKGTSPVGYDAPPDDEAVHFRVAPSLSFPTSTIQGLDQEEQGPPNMAVSFLGLTGAMGVLPQHYTEILLERLQLKDTSLSDFLDLFHHRTVSLFYRSWEKYRFPFSHERATQNGKEDAYGRLLHCLVGLGTKSLRRRMTLDDRALLFFGGHFSRPTRTAVALEGMTSELFGIPFRVEQNKGRWIELDPEDRSRLGGMRRDDPAARLGYGLSLGARVWDVQSKVRLHAGPLDYEQFGSLRQGHTGHARLADLVKNYLGGTINADLRMTLKTREAPRTRLLSAVSPPIEERSVLGRNAWLRADIARRLPPVGSVRMNL